MFRKVMIIIYWKTKWIYEWLCPYSTEKTWPLVSFDELCLLFGARPVTFQRAKTICKRHVTDFAQWALSQKESLMILVYCHLLWCPQVQVSSCLLYPSVIGGKNSKRNSKEMILMRGYIIKDEWSFIIDLVYFFDC